MKKIILIIEDELVLLTALADEFKEEGFTVITAPDGQAGLESALKNHPDLILLDILMPVMDGITMLNKLRKDKWGKNAKVVLLTNLSESDMITAEILKKTDGFIMKSNYRMSDIIRQVREKLA